MTISKEGRRVFFIPFNTPSSKNGKQWTGSKLIDSEVTRNWKQASKPFWEAMKQDFLEELSHFEKPYQIEFTFIRRTKGRFDYVGPLETVLDEMVDQGWLEDDEARIVKPHLGDFKYDKENPGVFIKILKMN